MLASANSREATRTARRKRFCPRRQLAIEVATGYLWLGLRIPTNATRLEIEEFVESLLVRLQDGATEANIAADLIKLQAEQLFEVVELPAIRRLATYLIELLRDSNQSFFRP